MLVSAGLGAATCYVLYHQIFGKKSDREIIEMTFRNINFGLSKQYPTHLYSLKKDSYTVHGFNLPYGLTDNPKLEEVIKKTLNRPVKIEMESHLKVKVYKDDLPRRINYDWTDSKPWTVPIGQSLDGMIYHDFDKVPHMTVAGMTRQGKTVFLKLMLAHLINNNPSVSFDIIDLKGGLEFGRYEKLKQIKNVASDPVDAESCLESISTQIKADMQLFKSKGYNDITNTNINRRHFIIVDEAAELTDSKKSQKYLSEIARIGGALGYRLIFATQYPTADTLPRQIKQNADAKISFRLPTEMASRVALDEQGAEQIECIGRAIYRTHERHLIQVPHVNDKDITERLSKYDSTDSTESEQVRTDTIEIV